MTDKRVEEILRRHSAKIESQISTSVVDNVNWSSEYLRFKEEMIPGLSRYERLCETLGRLFRLKPAKKDAEKLARAIKIAHLNVQPEQALTLSVSAFLLVFFAGAIISLAVVLIRGSLNAFPLLFFILMVVLSLFLFYFTNSYPIRLANKWRLKASSQMVPAVLYIVVYMRHTPNLEKAIAFAAEHLQEPLALDFKKVFYDLQIGKFSTIKESLDNYLETWRDYSSEFIESFHLIESSLFEPNNNQRIVILEKSLQVILDGVYDRMLKFTHEVRSPLTNVYMLGVVLPTLGLALLPLASALVGEYIKLYHVILLFNVLVPFFVFYLNDKIMLLRPGGYGETKLLERNPLYPQYKSRKPYLIAFLIFIPFLLISFMPLIFQYTPLPEFLGLQKDYSFSSVGLGILGNENIFGFSEGNGPFGFGALVLGMLFPLGIAFFFSIAYSLKTKELIKERTKTNELEQEFNNSLFQLGNRIGSGTPVELVFARAAESAKGLRTEDFFRRVNYNIQQMGMSVESAIFDSRRGAMRYYPSNLIATSMRILVEAAKKGLKIAAVSLMSISEYVRNINKITDRLRDLLAEVVSDMRSNMSFLAPLLSGIVVGLAVMITAILGKLATSASMLTDAGGFANLSMINSLFQIGNMIPPYYLQMVIGIYIIEIIFILSGTLVSIDSGEDKLQRTNSIGKNLRSGSLLYFATALIASVALFVLVAIVLGGVMA